MNAFYRKMKEMLLDMGFVDESKSDPLNMVHLERSFGDAGDVIVWGRDWSKLTLQWSQGDHNTVTIVQTEDPQRLIYWARATRDFVASVPPLNPKGKL